MCGEGCCGRYENDPVRADGVLIQIPIEKAFKNKIEFVREQFLRNIFCLWEQFFVKTVCGIWAGTVFLYNRTQKRLINIKLSGKF